MNNNDQPETAVLDFTKPDYTFVPKEEHKWQQQGPYLVCKSCELQHAVWIGINKTLTGFDKKGKPVLKNIKA